MSDFLIYDSPLTEEAKKIRISLMLVSLLCIFVGISGSLPERFAILGLSFNAEQQELLGWFMFGVTAYLLFHFLSVAAIDVARWVHPFLVELRTRRRLLKEFSHAFDPTDFYDSFPMDESDKGDIARHVKEQSDWEVRSGLRPLYGMIYLKLAIEVVAPFIVAIWGMVLIARHIT